MPKAGSSSTTRARAIASGLVGSKPFFLGPGGLDNV